jgi:hypothetical protein
MNSREAALFVTMLLAALAVILVVLYLRYRNLQMFHRERMAALEKGTAVPVGHTLAPWSPRVYLLRGLLWSFAGAGLIFCLLGIAASTHRPESIEVTMWRAKNLTQSLNISAEEARNMAEQERQSRSPGMPFSVALLGLIPLSVGLAYLVFYYTGRAQGADR